MARKLAGLGVMAAFLGLAIAPAAAQGYGGYEDGGGSRYYDGPPPGYYERRGPRYDDGYDRPRDGYGYRRDGYGRGYDQDGPPGGRYGFSPEQQRQYQREKLQAQKEQLREQREYQKRLIKKKRKLGIQ